MFLEKRREKKRQRQREQQMSFLLVHISKSRPSTPAYAPGLNAMLVQTQHNLTIASDNSPRFKTTLLIIIRKE